MMHLLVKLKNLCVSGQVRVQLSGLTNESPGFETLEICILKPPIIDFSLTAGGDSINIDLMGLNAGGMGIEPLIRSIILSALEGLMIFPKALKIPMISGAATAEEGGGTRAGAAGGAAGAVAGGHDFSEDRRVEGMLNVTVHCCKGLKKADFTGSDPYVIVKVNHNNNNKKCPLFTYIYAK
jgi:Ca2+-dependent lipid-binding protein